MGQTPEHGSELETMQALEPGDLVVLNGRARTWEVVETRNTLPGTPDDPPLVVKLVYRTGNEVSARYDVFVERMSDGHTCYLDIVESDRPYERGQTKPVTSIERLNTQMPWVVVKQTGSASTYHFPDPVLAARGEAAPACGGAQLPNEPTYRIVRIEAVYPAKQPCRDCAHHQQPRRFPAIECPDCGRTVGRAVFQGRGIDGVTGLTVTCRNSDCHFEGPIALNP